nr:dockerin type I repeat-containing protein [Clostridia bacterium]
TCTAAGTKTYTCSVCGAKKTETIAATGHAYGAWTKLNDTKHQRICANNTSHKETKNHVWNTGLVATPATCTVAGTKTYTCSVCGAKKTETIAATGHAYGAWTKLNDTKHQRICANDASHKETADHIWDNGSITTVATCTATGTKTYTCSVCGATREESIGATGHAYGAWVPLNDSQHQCVCVNDASHKLTGNHVWNNGEITKEPTAKAEGEKTFTCTVCGAVKTESLPKLNPTKEDYAPGDVDGNGQVLADDARFALRASAKLEILDERQAKAADVDGSGEVLADDARQILRFSAKLQHEFVKK